MKSSLEFSGVISKSFKVWSHQVHDVSSYVSLTLVTLWNQVQSLSYLNEKIVSISFPQHEGCEHLVSSFYSYEHLKCWHYVWPVGIINFNIKTIVVTHLKSTEKDYMPLGYNPYSHANVHVPYCSGVWFESSIKHQQIYPFMRLSYHNLYLYSHRLLWVSLLRNSFEWMLMRSQEITFSSKKSYSYVIFQEWDWAYVKDQFSLYIPMKLHGVIRLQKWLSPRSWRTLQN